MLYNKHLGLFEGIYLSPVSIYQYFITVLIHVQTLQEMNFILSHYILNTILLIHLIVYAVDKVSKPAGQQKTEPASIKAYRLCFIYWRARQRSNPQPFGP